MPGFMRVRRLTYFLGSSVVPGKWTARNRESVKHGKYGTLLYRCWTHIVQRTTNPRNKAFPLYGGRGITLYPPWLHDPAAFIAYIEQVLGERPSAYHSLDRKDNNGNYEPGNLRWAS